MTYAEMQKKILESADSLFETFKSMASDLLTIPEAGFFEEKTSTYVQNEFEKAGLRARRVAHTGVKATMGNGKYHVCIMGELDAIFNGEHPFANPATGMAHACGHNGQTTIMLGVMKTLQKADILDALNGRISFIGVPAEECIQTDKRLELIKLGKIKYMSGKQQLVYEGEMDDINCCMMTHALGNTNPLMADVGGSSMGFSSIRVTFTGRAAHAGAAPFDGINALDTAMLAMMNIHANRSTFKDDDRVRIHPILTKGGDVVNVVPSEVTMEAQVRAMTIPAMEKAVEVLMRSVHGACTATGASAIVESYPGYLPMMQDKTLSGLFMECAIENDLIQKENLRTDRDMMGSTDFGDLTQLLPTIQPLIGGVTGNLHSKEFCLSDENASLLVPIKIFSLMIAKLLKDGGRVMETVLNQYKPAFTKEAYLTFLDKNATNITY
ncbi:MAG TPA: amidohydrolase [Clostridiales bacterium]|jgi:amidohydrolase|nr:amidohydrolase [Clostridiales bacterium]